MSADLVVVSNDPLKSVATLTRPEDIWMVVSRGAVVMRNLVTRVKAAD